MLREALESQREAQGERHPDVLRAMCNVGWMIKATRGDEDECVAILREALQLQRDILGNEHPDTLTSINKLALILQDRGEHEEAASLCAEALETRRSVLGDRHPGTLISLCSLGSLLLEMGAADKAVALFSEAVEKAREMLGDEHPNTRSFIQHLNMGLEHQRRAACEMHAEPQQPMTYAERDGPTDATAAREGGGVVAVSSKH